MFLSSMANHRSTRPWINTCLWNRIKCLKNHPPCFTTGFDAAANEPDVFTFAPAVAHPFLAKSETLPGEKT